LESTIFQVVPKSIPRMICPHAISETRYYVSTANTVNTKK